MKVNAPLDRLDPPLDPAQLVRIEATHRGFGYQHLYAVACLLGTQLAEADSVIVEHDEDIELVRGETHDYVQVKTRDHPLWPGDVASALERFSALRNEHSQGHRNGIARFAIVSNAAPGPTLSTQLTSPSWPADVAYVWPGDLGKSAELSLPPAWPDLTAAFEGCVGLAASVPFSALKPETLVLKLAGLVQYLATGADGHAVSGHEVSEFFEQLVTQLQHFPEVPAGYRPLAEEPPLSDDHRVRLICGVSGAGKTAWASRMAMLSPSASAYFDAGELPNAGLASSLARELAATFLSQPGIGAQGVSLPAATGIELLALVSGRVREMGLDVLVVLDNAHRVSADALRELVTAAGSIRFTLLVQPWPGLGAVEAYLGTRAETLSGWSLDTTVAAFATAGCPIDASLGRRVLALSGGVPMYTQNVAQLAVDGYSGDVMALVTDLEARLNLVETAQEAILASVFDQMSPQELVTSALLDLSEVPLDRDEVFGLAGSTGERPEALAAAVRRLGQYGVIQRLQNGEIKLHDAYRLLARGHRATMAPAVVDAARERLVDLLGRSLPSRWTVGRFGQWARLLAQTDRLGTLIDLATHEQFHQIGDPRELKSVIEAAGQSADLSSEERFWALDALAFWEYCDHQYDRIPKLVDQMAALAASDDLGSFANIELSMKQMLRASLVGDREATNSALSTGLGFAESDERIALILRYNYALALYQLGDHEDAATKALAVAVDYFDLLSLELSDMLGTNVEHVLATAPDSPTRDDDFRHAADALDLIANARRELGDRNSVIARLHAVKLYSAAQAWRSAVRVGQDAVDDLAELGQINDARSACESLLLPVVEHFEFFDLLVPVRAQYAVILAWCGEERAARDEMSRLSSYQLSDLQAAELSNQINLIEQIVRDRQTH